MKKHVPSNKNGAILVIVMAVLVAFSLMVVALLQLGSFNEIETIKQLRTTQAHWLAEAGLERALSRVMGSANFLPGTSGTISTNFANSETLLDGLGSYKVTVHKTNYNNTVTAGYGITSVGVAGNAAIAMTNEVRLTFEAGPGGQQALLALGGVSKIQNSDVNGSICQYSGTLNFIGGQNSVNNGIVDATNDLPNWVPEGDLPDPGPPTVDQSPYSNLLATAKNDYPIAPLVIDSLDKLTNNLVGTTNYVNGNVTIKINIPANRTVVANGTVTLPSDVTLGAGVQIVSQENVSSDNHVTLADQAKIFTFANINLGNHSELTATSGNVLLAMGNITSQNSLNFTGVIFAGGKVTLATQAEVQGTIIAGQGFDIKNATITWDPSVFSDPNPINYNGAHYILPDTWQWAESPFF
jgi:Tfp pilus assembly protein PilX